MNRFFYLILISLFLSCQTSNDKVSFNRDVRPILNKSCLRCHGGVKTNGGFSMLFEEDAFAETQSGLRAIIPGDHKNSELFKRIVHEDVELRMPYESQPLSQNEIDVLARWIDQGAKWEKHWAYILPKEDIEPPEIENSVWTRNPIDNFVYAKMLENELTPATEADKATLLRRLSLDLIGLPPTHKEVQDFLSDQSENAYSKVVDRLLDSPHFGERWASMWLDLARYADSKGYEKDTNREIWKFRDYVINAFNEDMPYDQFTIEQLAGDLLPEPTEQQLIATAFHRNTMANDEGGTDNEEFRVASVIDRVSTTYEVWQGTTMSCVQCHSHPYDPFRHKEYYESMAFFNNSADKDIYFEQPKLFTYNELDAEKAEEIITYIKEQLIPEDSNVPQERFLNDQKDALLRHLGHRVVEAETYDESSSFIELTVGLKALEQIQDSSWARYDDVDFTNIVQMGFQASTPYEYGGEISIHLDSMNGRKIGSTRITKTGKNKVPVNANGFAEFKAKVLPTDGTHDLYLRFSVGDTYAGSLFKIDKIVYYEQSPRIAKYDDEFKQKIKELAAIPTTTTPILQELTGSDVRKTYVFDRGSWLNQKEEVISGIPDIYGLSNDQEPGNRLEFSKWLVSEENPLSARVAVNRFWEQIFGFGLVETMEEFGSQGEKPSHPELLDWLSIKFMQEHDWQVKPLLRELVLSATYRQESVVDSIKLEKDPRNKWLSRGSRTRLSAEQIRDQILTVSGLLVRDVGGPSVSNADVDGGWRGIPEWVIQGEEGLNRRSLYTLWKRVTPPVDMITFDSPDRSVCTSRRIRTNTPLQALNLLNDETFFSASVALAIKMSKTGPEIENQLKYGYREVMGYEIEQRKLDLLSQLYQTALEQYEINKEGADLPNGLEKVFEEDKYKLAALTLVSNALLNLDEFIVKG
jgi:hypothetical protein